MSGYHNDPAGQQVAGFNILHEGNHADRSNPHPQYLLPLLRTASATTTATWFPIIDKEFALDAATELKWKGFDLCMLVHDGRTDTVDQPAGLLRIGFHLRSDKTFHASAHLTPAGVKYHAQSTMTRYAFGEDLVRLYVTTINAATGVYRLRAFMRGTGNGCVYWLKPLSLWQDANVYTTIAFSNLHMMTAYRNLQENLDYLMLNQAAPIAFASLPVEDANTKLVRMQSSAAVAVLDALPTAYEFWKGKVVVVPTASLGDVAYQCVETNVAGTYRWDQARPIYGTAPPGGGAWTRGMFVTNIAPTVSGTAGSQYIVLGWSCTVAGTPGTWVACRTLTGT